MNEYFFRYSDEVILQGNFLTRLEETLAVIVEIDPGFVDSEIGDTLITQFIRNPYVSYLSPEVFLDALKSFRKHGFAWAPNIAELLLGAYPVTKFLGAYEYVFFQEKCPMDKEGLVALLLLPSPVLPSLDKEEEEGVSELAFISPFTPK